MCPDEGMGLDDRKACQPLERSNADYTQCNVPCPRCIGGGDNSEGCIGGFASRDCQSCPTGFYATKDECLPCKPLWMSLLLLLIIVLLLVLMVYVTRNNLVHRTLFLMVISFIVLSVIIFVLLAVEKPEVLSVFLEYFSVLGFYADVGSPGCYGTWNQHHRFGTTFGVFFVGALLVYLLESMFPKWSSVVRDYTLRHGTVEHNNGGDDVIAKESASHSTSTPSAPCPAIYFEHGCKTAWLLDKKTRLREARDTVLIMVYPSLLGYCLSVISCRASALVADPSVSCTGNPSYTTMAVVGATLFVALSVLVPLYMSNMIYRLVYRGHGERGTGLRGSGPSVLSSQGSQTRLRSNTSPAKQGWPWFMSLMEWFARRRRHDITKSTALVRQMRLAFQKLAKPSLGLIEEYKYPFFGVWNMVRKSAIILVMVVSTHSAVQLTSLLVVNGIHLAIVIRYRPYIHMSLNDRPSKFDPANHIP